MSKTAGQRRCIFRLHVRRLFSSFHSAYFLPPSSSTLRHHQRAMDALTAAEAILANVQNELDHLRHRIEQLGQNPRPWSNRAWRRRAEIMEELIAVGEAKLRALEVLEEVKEVRSFLPARPPMSFFADDRTSESLSTSRSTTMKAQTTTQMHARTRTSKAAPRLPRPHPPPRPAPPPPPPTKSPAATAPPAPSTVWKSCSPSPCSTRCAPPVPANRRPSRARVGRQASAPSMR